MSVETVPSFAPGSNVWGSFPDIFSHADHTVQGGPGPVNLDLHLARSLRKCLPRHAPASEAAIFTFIWPASR